MAAPPQPPDSAVLIDELVEEFLLRLPPEDPAFLARVSRISRQWYRVVTGPSFRHRFRELHRSTPPLLGYIHSVCNSIRFVPLSSIRPPRTHRYGVRVVSSNHGRVLLHPCPVKSVDVHLSVWHPITDEQQDLPVVPLRPIRYKSYGINWDAAVVCAVGNGCDHLHCHFIVVFVGVFLGNREGRNFFCFYSSEAGSWSDPIFAAEEFDNTFAPGEFIPIGTALYIKCIDTDEIFKYDFQTHQMCNISTTPALRTGRLIAAEDGRLGFAMLMPYSQINSWWTNLVWKPLQILELVSFYYGHVLGISQSI